MNVFRSKSAPSLLSIILLFMILSRLTWLQLRNFSIEANGLLSPVFGNIFSLEESFLRSWNMNVIMASFFLSALWIRFLSRKWVIALFALTVLMSRGVFLSRVQWFSLDLTFSCILLFWLSSLAHFLRTASLLSQIFFYVLVFCGGLLESSFLAITFVLPFYYLFQKLYRLPNASCKVERGGLLSSIESFEDWAQQQSIRREFLLAFFIVFLNLNIRSFVFSGEVQKILLLSPDFESFLDVHYVLSLLLVFSSSLYAFYRKGVFWSFLILFLMAFLLWGTASIIFSKADLLVEIGGILMWLEPAILCLSCACAFEILGDFKIFSVFAKRIFAKKIQHSITNRD